MQETIRIQINGEAKDWPGGTTVAELLRELEITTERVAVELNLEILDRAVFAQRLLKDGDRVEIMSFIGGGAPAQGQRLSRRCRRRQIESNAGEERRNFKRRSRG